MLGRDVRRRAVSASQSQLHPHASCPADTNVVRRSQKVDGKFGRGDFRMRWVKRAEAIETTFPHHWHGACSPRANVQFHLGNMRRLECTVLNETGRKQYDEFIAMDAAVLPAKVPSHDG